MTDLNMAKEIVEQAGFSCVGELDVRTLNPMDEVRDMCKSGNCRQYGKNWACPPGCGSLEECRERLKQYSGGLLVQTVGSIEDSMDWEGIKETEEKHKRLFLETAARLKAEYPDLLPLGSGTCTLCKACSYPEEPCRHPDRRVSSMEAYGLLINEVCTKNGMKYYHGPDTITYTACYLFA